MLYIGCPMWGYKGWVGELFPVHTPPSDFLRVYGQRLTTVEGNTTFYALPSADTVARWRQETPEIFRFCPKVSRSISHTPGLDTGKQETMLFIERMRGLGTRLGPMFLQLPPVFAPAHLAQLQRFLEWWPADVRLAVEVRHPDFYIQQHAATLDALLAHHRVARVVMDTRPIRVGSTEEQRLLQARERKPNLPLHVATTTDFAFVRYIGNPHRSANEAFLDAWAQKLAAWLQRGITPYVFCHCPFEEHSPTLCAALYKRVRALAPDIAPLPWQPEKEAAKPYQTTLFD